MTTPDSAALARKRRHKRERIVAGVVVLLMAGLAGWAIRWERAEKAALAADRRFIPREVTFTPEVAQLQELVRIDSSRPEGAAAAARWTAAFLEKNGIRAELIESGPSMLNVYARIQGRSPGQALLLFSHLDVVPPGKGWTMPPFKGALFGDRLYGRGTIDMKALTICQLAAMVEVARSGRPPAHDLVFLATADEETGSRFGMQWLLAHRPDLFEGVAYGLTEGGITELMGETMTYFGIEIGGKQMVQAVLEAPERESLQAARIALEPYMFSRRPERVLPEVRRFMAQLAPTRTAFRSHLQDIDATVRNGKFWELPATYRDFLQNSLSTGAIRGAGSSWTMEVTMLNLPDENPDARVAWLEAMVSPEGARVKAVPVKEGPTPFSSEQSPLFEILTREAEERYGVAAGMLVLYRSASDSRFLRPKGILCYGISPYPVSYFQSRTIHQPDEFITVGAFQEGVAFMKKVVQTWARG